jgi:hypothetical protein
MKPSQPCGYNRRSQRLRKLQLNADREPCNDPVFTRLIRDLQLARRVQQDRLSPKSRREQAEAFEHDAFKHLAAYLDVKAWTRQ